MYDEINKFLDERRIFMKKTLALLMSLALMITVVASFAVSSNAAPVEYVEDVYSYATFLETEYGKHASSMEADDDGARISTAGFTFDELWTYEYYDQAESAFKPMTAYFEEVPEDGWCLSTWDNLYTTSKEAALAQSPYTYCMVFDGGRRLHPSPVSGPAITFIVPADGTVSYDLAIYMYNAGSSAADWGNKIFVYQNDTKIWPQGEDVSIYADTDGAGNPYEVSVPSFNVKAGDKIRFMLHTTNGNNGGMGAYLSSLPEVTYHEASVPIGNPKGTPPKNVIVDRLGKDTTDIFVTWDAVKNATGYNVYLKSDADSAPVKVNSEPITSTEYTATGLKGKTLYDLTVTAVMSSGVESEASPAQTFVTPEVNSGSDKNTDVTNTVDTNNTVDVSEPGSKPVTSGSDKPTTDKPAEKEGFPLWIIIAIIAVVVVVAAAVVAVVVLTKKKSAAPAETPAEEPKE